MHIDIQRHRHRHRQTRTHIRVTVNVYLHVRMCTRALACAHMADVADARACGRSRAEDRGGCHQHSTIITTITISGFRSAPSGQTAGRPPSRRALMAPGAHGREKMLSVRVCIYIYIYIYMICIYIYIYIYNMYIYIYREREMYI